MMRRTMRHVAVLAIAAVMLTAIAVPAQSKGGSSQKIDYFSFKTIPAEAWCIPGDAEGLRIDAYDYSSKPRYLVAFFGDLPCPTCLDWASGTGHLQVQAVTDDSYAIGEHYTMYVGLFSLNPKTEEPGKLIESHAFNWWGDCP